MHFHCTYQLMLNVGCFIVILDMYIYLDYCNTLFIIGY